METRKTTGKFFTEEPGFDKEHHGPIIQQTQKKDFRIGKTLEEFLTLEVRGLELIEVLGHSRYAIYFEKPTPLERATKYSSVAVSRFIGHLPSTFEVDPYTREADGKKGYIIRI